MSEPPVGAATIASISERLIRVLPPAFLLLIVLNVLFLGGMLWLFESNVEARTQLLTKIVEKCLLDKKAELPVPGPLVSGFVARDH